MTNTQIKRSSISFVFRGIQINITTIYHYIPTRIILTFFNLTIADSRKNMDTSLLMGIQNGTNTTVNSSGISHKVKHTLNHKIQQSHP